MIKDDFKRRMQNILGDEYPEFISSLELNTAVRGMRVNLIKCPSGVIDIEGVSLSPVSYCDNGYILSGDVAVGRLPEHHAGLIYMQDPGAMSTLTAVDIRPDMWVADLCAAPGGKSGQVAERLGNDGFLLSNEYVAKRAKITVTNLERLGISRAIVTSMDTGELARLFSSLFDLVVADAPCSGEGMFRKSEEARAEWSEENVRISAKRQTEILDNAYRLLRPRGMLLYSTCTWSIEENEEQVLAFLKRHPDMHLIPVKASLASVTSDGIVLYGHDELKLTRRCYPHKMAGEGQFIALFMKDEGDEHGDRILFRENVKSPSREDERVVMEFFNNHMKKIPEGRLITSGGRIILVPHNCPIPPHKVFMAGVLIGEVKRGILHPEHQFFSVYGKDFKNTISLDTDDKRLGEYLSGLEIECESNLTGYVAILYRGATLGGGKASGGRIKNHYPKGLRNTM